MRKTHTVALALSLAAPALAVSAVSATADAAAAERYDVTVDAPKSVKAGKDGIVKVTVKPKNSWHLNLDFPTSVKVTTSDGLQVPKEKLKKGDAKKLDENLVTFEVKFTAKSKGSQSMDGKVKFAVCSEDACQPVSEKIKVAVKVN